jgi:hypothetical protein
LFTNFLAELMQNLLATVQPHDMVRLSINSPGLDHEIWLPFMKPAQLTADRIMIEAERVLQSKKEWLLEGNLLVKFIHAPLPVGGGRFKQTPDAETYLKKKHSIISIPKSKDNLCCAKAIITAKAKLDKHPKWESIKRGRKIQQQLAEELQRVAGIPYGTLCGRVEWDKFQKVLGNDYELIVISRDFFNAIVYNSLTQGSKKVILYHADQHFSVITSMTAFMGRSYYCTMCNTPYNNPGGHKCDLKCSKCQASKKCVFEAYNVCDACHRVFVSNLCLQNHRVNGLCSYIQSCPSCGKTYHTYTKHKC